MSGFLSAGIVGGPDIPDSGVFRLTLDNSDTSGGSALDVWNSNDATINGATTGISGANQTYTTNEGYSLDGVDDFLDGNAIPMSTLSEFSLACWVYPEDATDGAQFIFTSNYNSGDDIRISVTGASFDDGDINGSVSYNLTSNAWNHLTITHDGSTLEAYVDGGSVDSLSETYDYAGLNDNTQFGYRPAAGMPSITYLAGDIDDIRGYSRGLTSTEVSNLYNNGAI